MSDILPGAGAINDVDVTVTDQRANLENLRTAVFQGLGRAPVTTLSIASGSITPDRASHKVDTESSAPADDLTNINASNLPDGYILALRSTDPARVITVKHAAGGAGQISLLKAADLTLNNFPRLFLEYDATAGIFREVFYSQFYLTLADIADGLITFAKLASAAKATAGEYLAATAGKLLAADIAWAAAAPVTIADNPTIALDMSTFVHGVCVIAGNRTLGNPTNAKPGQSGTILITASGTTRTLSFGSNWRRANTVETTPLSITTAEEVLLSYYIKSATEIRLAAVGRYTP